MLSLQWPWLLLLLPLPWLLPRPKALASAALQLPWVLGHDIENSQSPKPKRLWMVLAILVWGLTLLASTRPLWLGQPIPLSREGRDLMLAVDLSGSMEQQDMVLQGRSVSRLELVKSVLGEFIEKREGDRLGLILFADDAYVQAPLTFDRNSIKRYLGEAEIGLVGTQTAIGSAIALASKRFTQLEQSNKTLILLTDGVNNAGDFSPEQATQLAREIGVKLYTIGVGSSEQQQRSLFGSRTINPSAELDAAEQSFIRLSESTGGRYFRARNPQELHEIYQTIDALEPIAREQQTWRPQTELYPYLLAPALMLLMLLALGRRFG